VKKSPFSLLVLCSVGLPSGLGCGSDEPSFLPLSDLCDVYAEEICDARQACCEGGDAVNCEMAVRDACKADETSLTQQEELSYDGRRADRVRGELQDELDQCGAPLSVARFFNGARAVGEACEQRTQCESLNCAADATGTLLCTESASQQLCDPADI
jgi:hypothetical protein